jgi:TolA-binding protein
MRLVGAGLTALVAVLALVLMHEVQQQARRSQALERRVQALENSRDLERTQALEAQLRAMVQRLQNLEARSGQMQELVLQQEELRRQLQLQRLQQNAQPPELLPFPEPGPVPAPGRSSRSGAKAAAKSAVKSHPTAESRP